MEFENTKKSYAEIAVEGLEKSNNGKLVKKNKEKPEKVKLGREFVRRNKYRGKKFYAVRNEVSWKEAEKYLGPIILEGFEEDRTGKWSFGEKEKNGFTVGISGEEWKEFKKNSWNKF